MMLKRIMTVITRFLFVPKCVLCKKVLPVNTPLLICGDCQTQKFCIENVRKCILCSKPITTEVGEELCLACQKKKPVFEKGYSLFVYEGLPKNALARFKFYGYRWYAEGFGKLMAHRLQMEGCIYDAVCYVPLHPKRLRKRGYHQTMLLAQVVATDLDLPLMSALVKIKHTPPQQSLKKSERVENVKGAYEFNSKAESIKGKKILLIDDIYTTGATLTACTKSLKKAGAKEVFVATVAIGKDL